MCTTVMLLPRQVDFICMHLLEVLELWASHGTNWASLSGPLDSVPGKIRNQGAPHWTSSHYIYMSASMAIILNSQAADTVPESLPETQQHLTASSTYNCL